MMQKRQVAEQSIVETHAKPDQQSFETKVLPTFEEAIAPNQKSQTGLPQGWLYTSEKNKFSVMLPPDTKVEERVEAGNYTITYFNLKESVHKITISSYNENVHGGNLKSLIGAGTEEMYFLTGKYDPEHQIRCGEIASLCFLSQLYSQSSPEYPEPRLLRVAEDIFSQTEFSKFYEISMGAYYPALSDKDLALFSMIHDSFRLDR